MVLDSSSTRFLFAIQVAYISAVLHCGYRMGGQLLRLPSLYRQSCKLEHFLNSTLSSLWPVIVCFRSSRFNTLFSSKNTQVKRVKNKSYRKWREISVCQGNKQTELVGYKCIRSTIHKSSTYPKTHTHIHKHSDKMENVKCHIMQMTKGIWAWWCRVMCHTLSWSMYTVYTICIYTEDCGITYSLNSFIMGKKI